MNNNYSRANKVRINLLLFIDKELRNKIPNISKFNNSNYEEIQLEEIFSNDNKECSNLINNSPYKENQNRNINKKLTGDNKNFHVSIKDINYKCQSSKKFSSTLMFINTEKVKKNNPKEYLKCLCNNMLILSKKSCKATFTFHSNKKKKHKLTSTKKTNRESKGKTKNKTIIPESSMLVTAFRY